MYKIQLAPTYKSLMVNVLTLTLVLVWLFSHHMRRSESLSQQVLTAAAKLKGVSDPDLAAAFSVMLLCLGSEDANPSYLASAAAAVLMSQLLQVQAILYTQNKLGSESLLWVWAY